MKYSNLPVKEFFTVQSVSTSACSFKGQAAEVSQVEQNFAGSTVLIQELRLRVLQKKLGLQYG